jgi:hypothetical protein
MPLERRFLHLPLLAVILAAMVIGILAGLARIGWMVPDVAMARAALHGPLLIAGVFGTLISLERAIAMRNVTGRTWTPADAAPVLGGAGTVVLLVSGTTVPALLLIAGGAVALLAVHLEMLRRHPTLDIAVMGIGAAFLVLADAAWLAGRQVPLLTPWWVAFLVLTIVGERVELARIRFHGPAGRRTFAAAVGLYVVTLLLISVDAPLGVRLSGLGLLAITAWLLRHDVAWLTVRKPGFPRYSAICLLTGYAWLGVAGLILVATPQLWAALTYDAFLHAVLLGFVFSMIFAHAPFIVPGIVGRRVGYSALAWLPLVLLHLSVVLRIVGDLRLDQDLRHTSGLLSGIAILLYGAVLVIGLLRGPEPVQRTRPAASALPR